jgi:hypothetical protein
LLVDEIHDAKVKLPLRAADLGRANPWLLRKRIDGSTVM